MNQEELLELAPGEYTEWEKRVWARGYAAGSDKETPPEAAK